MTSILAFILVLGVLIVVHELGHFITAKLAGIAVPRFSVGLGPKVWGFKHGETEYVLSALPLGGYVKMAGMGEDEALEVLEGGKDELEVPPERRFDSKSVGARAIVISAGVVMNYVFAIVAFGFIAWHQSYGPLIGTVEDGWPAQEAGVQAGDLVLALNGEEIELWAEFQAYVFRHPGDTVDLLIERGDQEVELRTGIAVIDTTITDPAGNDTTIVYGRIGVMRDTLDARRAYGPTRSLGAGYRQNWDFTVIILDFLGQLLTGRASARDLGGPIMIGQLSGQAARAGALSLINFMAILSVHLAVLNLLPIPILDGGHLLFLGIEAVRGRALSIQARARAAQVGFVLIMALMVWVITSDLLRLTGR
jgi:regulator of sigma E protease